MKWTTFVTMFNKLTENLLHIFQQKIKDAKEKLKANKITCDNIQSVDITVFYNCVTCSKKVQFQQGSPMLRCMNCRSRFLIKNSTKTTTARISIKKTDQTIWYSLFTSTIEAMIKKYNKDNNESETIEDIDEDKLCQVILTTTGIKLRVSSTNTVLTFPLLSFIILNILSWRFCFSNFSVFLLKSHCYIFVVSLIVITLEV